jgi:hypothetical protein
MARVRDVLVQALDLSRKQRARVAHELLSSLDDGPPEDHEDVERSWAEVVVRRVDALMADTAKTVSWRAVRREIELDLARFRVARTPRIRRRSGR